MRDKSKEAETLPKAKDAQASFRHLLKLARPEWKRLLAATLFLLLSASLGLSFPKFLGAIIDGITRGEGVALIDRTALILLGLFAIMGFAIAIRSYLFTVAGERIVSNLRTKLYQSLVYQDIGFFDGEKTGDLMNRLSSDTTVLQNAVTVNLSMGLRFAVTLLGSLLIMAFSSWRLTVVMLAIVPVVAIGGTFYARALRKVSRKVRDALAEASAVAEESLSGIRTVRAYAREVEEGARYSDKIELAFGLARTRARLGATFHGVMSFAGYGAIVGVLWYGGRLVNDKLMTFGELSAFILYTFSLAFSLSALSALWADFAKALGASERVFELLFREPTLRGGEKKLDKIDGRLKFEEVCFSYPTRPEVTVLNGFDIELNAGETLALVGPSGGGKSTVAALISRFYDPQSGLITLDGTAYSELDPDWLREQIGVVSQEPVLFATSIAENIRYGCPRANTEQVLAAAQAANAHDFIADFPDGYETLVGERGVRLSGGQKQRVAIARALLKDPKLLILDEATSALDAESEHLVQEALDRLQEGRTTLVIAHRLSTVKDADRVVVIDQGKIQQVGTHSHLIRADGLYRRLVERQFAVA
jgi:ABC transporter fused permease/ATP-binding protein